MSEFAFTTTTRNDVARFHDTINMTRIDQLIGRVEASADAAMSATEPEACNHQWNQMDARLLDLAMEMITSMYVHLPSQMQRQLIEAKAKVATYLPDMSSRLDNDLAVGYTIPPKK